MKNITLMLTCSIIIFSCNDANKTADKTTNKELNTTVPKNTDEELTNSPSLFNSIELKASGGVKVIRAFLAYESGELVRADNKVQDGQTVKLNLNLDGWAEQDGKVFTGASERLTTAEGVEIINAEDLFDSYPDGINAQDAKFIKLSVSTPRPAKETAYYLVEFRVWNKKGAGELRGSYKLYLSN